MQTFDQWDRYDYVSVSTDNGTTWTNLAGTYQNGNVQSTLTTSTNPNNNNLGNGITGTSNGAWRLASFSLTPYAGQTVLLRLRYKTDPFTSQKGIMADEFTLGSFADGAETGNNGWTLNGFKATSGVESSNAPHYYIAEYRQYRTYWYASTPTAGVIVPKTGTTIRAVSMSAQGGFMQVQVSPAK